MSLTRDQLRAARALLCLDQSEMARLSEVALVTLRRYESGMDVADQNLDKLRAALEAAGALLIQTGTPIGGAITGIGVALRADDDLPERTRKRIAEASAGDGRARPKRDPALPKQDRRGRPRKMLATPP